MITYQIIYKVRFVESECFIDKFVCWGLRESVTMSQIVVKGTFNLIIVILCVYVELKHVFEVAPGQIYVTSRRYIASLHQLVEVAFDANNLLKFLFEIFFGISSCGIRKEACLNLSERTLD